MTRIQDIPDMATLRVEIDALDARLMALMAERHALIDRAAQIKSGNGMPARIDARVEEVVANVRAHAQGHGLDPDLYDRIWRLLIEAAIAQEERQLHKDRP
ncbi:chorismate mutase [Paracoccus gahaiensis]|uniref:chorismate mutase n=1 Tax=Paracoccus gahaiensis TaxID=1706839 RepID=A0A4U0RR37_9RHOB|nr:chorismate mutase [Paracoccus gahaiensis]TJZ90744.1 chorismate mutase [Paracoccus gahaiensis]